ncbi:NAD(P)-binding domain-containing protein [Streptomyces sp. NPDC016469]|uniref:NAD(P)-binding domain-containing protein n=1 Tax=Streptomyces sp. NPDC016469 TaxID=3157191 RepID=UPI0033D9B3D6
MPFPGADRDRYPHRDEVVAYLTAYAGRLGAEIRTGCGVGAVRRTGDGFEVVLEGGGRLSVQGVVAAFGTFGRPFRPALPGLEKFTGQVLHAADYRDPDPFAGRRVVVVGARNSAVQIAAELAETARVTLATRTPVKFAAQRILGRDLHFWTKRTGLDIAPLGRLLVRPPAQPVLDDGLYRAALTARRPERRLLFTDADGAEFVRPDGRREGAEAIVLATDYRPDPPRPALPRRPRRRPGRRGEPAARRGPGRRCAGAGVRRAGVAARPVIELAARGRPRRAADRPAAGSPPRASVTDLSALLRYASSRPCSPPWGQLLAVPATA